MRPVALFLALLASSCYAQHVQHCTASSFNANPSCALASPVTVGNKLIVIVIEGNGSGTPGVTDVLGNTFGSGITGSGGWTIGFNGAQCGAGSGGGGFCFNTLYPAPITIGGSDTITFSSGVPPNETYWMYVGEYAGIGSFDIAGGSCAGGFLAPCNGPPSGGSQSTSVVTATTNSFLFAVAACDYDTSIGAPGCTAAPTNTTGTFRANVYIGGCPGPNCMLPTIFDDLGGPPGTYTETANVGATTNWVVTVWSFGFTAPAAGFSGYTQIL